MYLNPKHRRSPLNQTINNAFPNELLGTGIVHATLSKTTFYAPNTDAIPDSIAYLSRSGDRFLSPIVYRFLDSETGEITEAGLTALSSALYAQYGPKWEHLYSLYTADYDPLANSALIETRNLTEETEETKSNIHTNQLSDIRTPDITAQRTDNLSEALMSTVNDIRTLNTQDAKTANSSDTRTLDTEDSSTHNTTDTRTLNTTNTSTKSGTETTAHDTTDTRTLNLSLIHI